jgi:hypothetical protein
MKTLFFYFFSITIIILYSCNKENEELLAEDETQTQETAKDHNQSMLFLDDILQYSNMGLSFTGNTGKYSEQLEECVQVTHLSEEKKIIMNFGDGCTGPMGRIRKGKMIIQYSGKFRMSNWETIVTFENYSVNGNSIEGKITTNSFVRSATGILSYKVTFENLETIFARDGLKRTVNLIREVEMIKGENSGSIEENELRISHKGTIKTRTGITYSISTISPKTFKGICVLQNIQIPVSGEIAFKSDNGRKWSINYGNGECDKKITIKIGDKTFEIEVS